MEHCEINRLLVSPGKAYKRLTDHLIYAVGPLRRSSPARGSGLIQRQKLFTKYYDYIFKHISLVVTFKCFV